MNAANGTGATNPFRLDVTQAATSDQDHAYTPEQQSFDSGLMDLFPLYTGVPGPPPPTGTPITKTNGLVMGYFDGNTVTALWHYAVNHCCDERQLMLHRNFGPSTPGLINLVSGQTNGVVARLESHAPRFLPPDSAWMQLTAGITVIGDAGPAQ